MASSVNTSFQVSFGTDADGAGGAGSAHLSAEVDDRPEGGNAGRTSFVPGDTVHFLVFKSANVSYNTPIPSAGSVARAGTATVEKDIDVVFADENTGRIGLPATSIVSVKWMGNALGNLSLSGTEVIASSKGVAVAKVKVLVPADVWTLASPASIDGETDYSILVYILGSIA